MKPKRALLLVLCCAMVQSAWTARALAQRNAGSEPKHLATARSLVAHLDLRNTDYEHGAGTVHFTSPYASRTDCSGFANALLADCYGFDKEQFRKLFGSGRPTAHRYYDAIEQQQGFKRIEHVQEMLPGDFLAVKYLHRKDNTGHVMLVAGRPTRLAQASPVVSGTQQWQVPVIDSSQSGHGPTDTRHKKGANGKDHAGLGEGAFRIYCDSQGRIAGFSWSTLAASKFVAPKDEVLVIGRLHLKAE